jgi:hypothetical protein
MPCRPERSMDPAQNIKPWPREHPRIERLEDGGPKESGNQREICSYDHERWR